MNPRNGLAMASLEGAFAAAQARDRQTIENWLFHECKRFVGLCGGYSVMVASRDVFRAEVLPVVSEFGSSIEDWVAELRVRAKWSGV